MKQSPYCDPSNAATYDRLSVPHQFSAPAKDLVEMLQLPSGGRVLDVGSGTGAAAIPAAESVGCEGLAVALDASADMLQILQKKGLCRVVVGEVPKLPFRDGSFQAVMGSFVLSHFRNYRVGLADMIRVLHPGGRLGLSAWAAGRNPFGQLWSEIAAEYVSSDDHQRAFSEIIPWDEWFSQEGSLERALEEAGLVRVEVYGRTYTIAMNVEDYVSLREASVEGTLLRRNVEAGQWNEFRARVRQAFHDRFNEPIEYERGVYFGLGTKRDSGHRHS